MKANMEWAKGLPVYPPRTALIVAGDVVGRCMLKR
jgi:hypothetical protein